MSAQDDPALFACFLREGRRLVATIADSADSAGAGPLFSAAAGPAAERPPPVAAPALSALRIASHRLSGSSALYGFPHLSRVAAVIEERVEAIALEGDPDGEFLPAAVAGLQRVFADVEAGKGDGSGAPLLARLEAAAQRLELELRRFARDQKEVLEYFLPEAEEHLEGIASCLASIHQQGATEPLIATLFRFVHTLKGASFVVGCTPVGEFSHGMENLMAAIRGRLVAWSPETERALLAGYEVLRVMIAVAAGRGGDAADPATAGAAELAAAGAAAKAIERLLPASQAEPPAVAALASREVPPEPPPASPQSQVPRAPERGSIDHPAAAAAAHQGRSIRVNTARIDELMEQVGELVITRGRLAQHLEQLAGTEERTLASRGALMRTVEGAALLDQEQTLRSRQLDLLRDDSEQLSRLLRRLRGAVGRARMVRLRQVFARLRRVVTTAAEACGREVVLKVEGEAVEVDAAVAEMIADPLMHLLQNTLSHGIEPAEERLSRGKPAAGQLELKAQLRGHFLTVEVADDGRGMVADDLRRRAVALGLQTAVETAALPDLKALELIFLPGFSTSRELSRGAGRGVGMHVVWTNLTQIGAEVQIDTVPGAGTRFTLKLPLTLMVSEALFLRVGAEHFAIATSAVRKMVYAAPGEIVRLERAGGEESGGRDAGEVIAIEGGTLPLLRLGDALGLETPREGDLTPVLCIEAAGRSCALAVDEFLGIHEVVIKSLGELLAGLARFAGATITSEGRLVLLLDPAAFTRDSPPAAAARDVARQRPSILVVDDSRSARKVLCRILEERGYRVAAAADGEDARGMLREQAFDAVLTDLEMPRMTGFELIAEIRRLPFQGALPIVVISSLAGDKHMQHARRLGATAFFGKPYDQTALLAEVGKLTGNPGGLI